MNSNFKIVFVCFFVAIILIIILIPLIRLIIFWTTPFDYCGVNEICSDEDLADLSTSGSGTLIDPYIIENQTFEWLYFEGFTIDSSFIIRNCSFDDLWYGYCLYMTDINSDIYDGSFTIIDNCTFHRGGIYLEMCEYMQISNNRLINNINGLFLESSCRNMNITGNILDNLGIFLPYYFTGDCSGNFVNGEEIGFFQNVNDTLIEDSFPQLILNRCNNVTITNQTISQKFAGIITMECWNITIRFCRFTNNSYGIHAEIGGFFLIEKNEFTNNTISSMYLVAWNSTIYNNNFLNNSKGYSNSQAINSGRYNNWDYNYWSNWTDSEPYFIGTYYEDYYDNYPLSEPVDIF